MSIPKNRDTPDLFEEIKKISEYAANKLREEYHNEAGLLRLTKKDLKKHLPDIRRGNIRKEIKRLIKRFKKKNRDTVELLEEIKKISEDAANILHKEYHNEDGLLRLTKKDLKKHLPDIHRGNIRKEIKRLIKRFKKAKTSEHDNDKLSSKLKKPVHVLVVGETFHTHESFMKKLKLKEVPTQENSKVILVFCPVVSRIGTDMETAMARVTVNKPVILVFMHHCHHPSHMTNITVQPSRGNIVKTVHCAFHESKGLLQCKENNLAVEAVRSELKEYNKKK